jgi:hydrogenase-4 membrane subunit HyfE
VRTAAIVFNVISSLASLAMAGLGWIVTMIARIPAPEQQDQRVLAYGVALIVSFLVLPVVCVAMSGNSARQNPASAVFWSLVPAVLVAAAVTYFVWAGTYVPIHQI